MYIGYAAAFLTTVSFLPQAWKTIKTRNTDGISVLMYLCMVVGVFFWLVYGVLLGAPSIIIANAITFVLSLAICIMKYQFDQRDIGDPR